MGWAGAMSGLGKGMSNYAESMREQSRLNWKSQQDAIAAERLTNLENLRASNNRSLETQRAGSVRGLAEDRRGWAAEQSQTEFDRSQGALTGGYNAEGFPVSKAEMAKDPEGIISPSAQKEREAVSVAQAEFTEKQRQAEIVREKRTKQLHESTIYKESGKDIKDYLDMADQVGPAFITALSKLKGKERNKVTAAMIKQVYEMNAGDDAFANLDTYSKMIFVNTEADKIANPSNVKTLKTVRPDQVDATAQQLADGKIGIHDLDQLDPYSKTTVIMRAIELGETPSMISNVIEGTGAALQATPPERLNPITGAPKPQQQATSWSRARGIESQVPIGPSKDKKEKQPGAFQFSNAGVFKR